MLRKITDLPDDYVFEAMIRGWCAVDLASGATLTPSHGRTSKAPKYVLIVPKAPPASEAIADHRAARQNWDYDGRKFLRAWSDDEAIAIANEKLTNVLAKR